MCHLVTMPYKDPEKRVRDLHVVLTPLTRDECQIPIERLQRRKAVARDVECRACAERVRERREAAKRRRLERNKAWKKANREKVRESKRKWREKNRERVNEQTRNRRKKVREQKRNWEEKDQERDRERERKRKQRWRQNNPEKVREHARRWVEKNREKVREQKQQWRQDNRERNREQKRRWRQANREKVREQKRKRRQANPEKVREEQRRRRQADPEKVRAREQIWRDKNREKLREQKQRWRKNNPEKVAAQRQRELAARARLRECWKKNKPKKKRNREVDRACSRRYHAAHREQCNQKRKERKYKQMGRPVPPPPPPCDCGICVACGGWGVSWKPAWYARLDAFCAPKDQSTPATILDLLESEAETMSLASTSEIGSELGDRLDSLLMDESDSEVETGDKVEAPTRRSTRIAKMPSVSYKDWDEEEKLMREFLNRKTQLHADGVDRIVTRWELLEQRTERVDAIVNEMSTGMDPTHQLDRFHSQLERQDYVLDVMVSEDLLDWVDGQLA